MAPELLSGVESCSAQLRIDAPDARSLCERRCCEIWLKGHICQLCRPDTHAFYDAKVLLGQPGPKQTQRLLRLVGYFVDGKKYWVATDRFDLTADEIALIYKLCWEIEKFFGWQSTLMLSNYDNRHRQRQVSRLLPLRPAQKKAELLFLVNAFMAD